MLSAIVSVVVVIVTAPRYCDAMESEISIKSLSGAGLLNSGSFKSPDGLPNVCTDCGARRLSTSRQDMMMFNIRVALYTNDQQS